MSILVKGDDVRSGTKLKANACRRLLRPAQESMRLVKHGKCVDCGLRYIN